MSLTHPQGVQTCDRCGATTDVFAWPFAKCRGHQCAQDTCPECAVPGTEQDDDGYKTVFCLDCAGEVPTKCERCGKAITKADERVRHERGDRDQPPYDEPACRFCSPTSEDLDRARDAHLDRLEAEAAENGWLQWR